MRSVLPANGKTNKIKGKGFIGQRSEPLSIQEDERGKRKGVRIWKCDNKGSARQVLKGHNNTRNPEETSSVYSWVNL